MRDIFTLFLHAIVIMIRLARPGGFRSVVAESVLLRHQVLILNRGRKRAPNQRASDRIIGGLCTLLMSPARVLRSGIALKPATLLHFHKMPRGAVSWSFHWSGSQASSSLNFVCGRFIKSWVRYSCSFQTKSFCRSSVNRGTDCFGEFPGARVQKLLWLG
jgi:hypothetical protein